MTSMRKSSKPIWLGNGYVCGKRHSQDFVAGVQFEPLDASVSVPASGLALMHVMWVIWQRLSRSVEYIDPADVEVTWIDQRREPAATWTPGRVRL